MRRLKICHLLYGLNIGGIETLAVKLVNRMDRDAFDHLLLCLTPQNELDGEVDPDRARIIHLDRKEGTDLAILPRITAILLRERPHVVHTRNWSTFVEGVLPSLAARTPGRVHSFDGLNADNLGPEPRRRILAQRALLPTIQQIVARSEAMRDAMCQQLHLDPSRITLIADGIDLDLYDQSVDVPAVRQALGLTMDHCVVGIVARLDPVKDHLTLIRAIALAQTRIPHLRLVVVGGGPLEESLRSSVRELGVQDRVIFTGPRLDVRSLYRAMDLYCQPSLYEGVSGSLLEAMAARLPVISTPVGGTVDIVSEGANGYLVPVGDAETLAVRLLELSGDPERRRQMGLAGRRLVQEQYSLQQVIQRYSGVYREAAGLDREPPG